MVKWNNVAPSVYNAQTSAAGEDYLEVIPQITQFAISSEGAESRWCTTIQIMDDQEYEGGVQESLVVSLSMSDTAVIINRNSATVSILDNEGMHLVIQSQHISIYECIFAGSTLVQATLY